MENCWANVLRNASRHDLRYDLRLNRGVISEEGFAVADTKGLCPTQSGSIRCSNMRLHIGLERLDSNTLGRV